MKKKHIYLALYVAGELEAQSTYVIIIIICIVRIVVVVVIFTVCH